MVAGRPRLPVNGNSPRQGGGLALRVSISDPLKRRPFLLPPRSEVVRVTGKALCREPFKKINWFVDGREVAATGPPYELPLDLPRGRHRITVVGPGTRAIPWKCSCNEVRLSSSDFPSGFF